MEFADGVKLDGGYFTARSNGGIFSGKILKPQRSSKPLLAYVRKVKVIFSLDVNKILRFQVTLYPLCAKNVITQLVLVTNKCDRNVESIMQLMIC